MIQTAEQIIESVRALPSSEREKFFDLAEAEKRNYISENGSKEAKVAEEIAQFRLAEQWIEDHKEEYDGQWVCLYGDKLIAHGIDGVKVYKDAKAKGIKIPFIERIKAKELPFGGW